MSSFLTTGAMIPETEMAIQWLEGLKGNSEGRGAELGVSIFPKKATGSQLELRM
jgi:hypothetical protein